ncbi:MAG: ABC-2 family transporter protein [Planctomycetota bacterium]|nr:ABC-2 family transporter protein [Planctomycetota bacterium]
MIASWRVHWFVLQTSISERLTYRGDFVLGTLVRFLPIVTQVFLWTAIYAGDEAKQINGYRYRDMVAYALLVMLGRAFSSMPGLAGGIARDIRDGTIKKYLTQPIDMLGFLFWARVAHKLVYYAVAGGPFILMFWLCRGYFTYELDVATVAAFALSLILGFLVGFLMESLIGLIGFWFLEVSSLIFICMMLNYFLSGHMIPLDWIPSLFAEGSAGRAVATVTLKYLPFQYMAYFPAAVILGKIQGEELVWHLVAALCWVMMLYAANRVAFARGVRRYSAYGG